MPGRTPQAAARAFRESLQRSLDCVVDARLNIDGYRPSQSADVPYTADVNGGKPTPFARHPDLRLVVIIKYLVVAENNDRGPWAPRVVKYEYALENPDGGEILAYHWHPNARNAQPWPHLHIGEAILAPPHKDLSNTHVRTGRVALEDLLWYALHDLKIPPTRRHIGNWEDVLRRERELFERLRSRP